jgi:hypothetical protein
MSGFCGCLLVRVWRRRAADIQRQTFTCPVVCHAQRTQLGCAQKRSAKDALLKLKDWIALRDWVGNNIQYQHDDAVHGVRDYWQFGKETVALKTGDCEDFSILLCSLLRAAGYSPNDVYVVIGKNPNGYHAWVKINLGTLGWYNLEPQENGFATLVGDFLTLSDYHALYEFNDQQFHQIG